MASLKPFKMSELINAGEVARLRSAIIELCKASTALIEKCDDSEIGFQLATRLFPPLNPAEPDQDIRERTALLRLFNTSLELTLLTAESEYTHA